MTESTPPAKPASTTPSEPETATPTTTATPAEPVDDLVTTEHTLRIGRRRLAYTATTGRIVLREEVVEDGKSLGLKPKAELSVTSYVVQPESDTARPVMFASLRSSLPTCRR